MMYGGKLIIALSAVVFLQGIHCASPMIEDEEEWIHKVRVALTHSLSKVILSQLQKIPEEAKSDSELRVPIFSPLPDPLTFQGINLCGFSLPIDALGYALYGDLNIEKSEVTGLSELTDDLTTSLFTFRPPFTVNYSLSYPSMMLKGPFMMDAILDQQGQESVLLGEGNLTFSLEDVFFRFSATGRAIIGKLELQALDVDIGFSSVAWSFDGLTADGSPWDMSSLAALVKLVFDMVWTETSKPVINEAIRCSLNHTVHVSQNCYLMSLLLSPNDCLTREPNPACGIPSPTADLEESLWSIRGTDICDATVPPTEYPETEDTTTRNELTTPGASSIVPVPFVLLILAILITQIRK